VFNWFKKEKKPSFGLRVDIHSHLLPGIDDGVKTFDEATAVIQVLADVGYKKLITTPHVISDIYRNTPAIITEKCRQLADVLAERKIDMQIHAAAEYYLDESLFQYVESGNELMRLAGDYVLFETNFLNEPLNLKDFIFLASSKGYKLVLAHPERYLYMSNDLKKAEELIDRGVLFQINISSLTGYYSKGAQSMANKLIDRGFVHWLGSDCHHMAHASMLKTIHKNKYFQKALSLPLLNNSIE
jgi:protein-tyrosine phosphatase